MEQKIFKLDVFKVFYQKPKTLLYRPNAGGRPRSASTMSYTTRGGGGAMGSRTMGTRRHHSSQPFSLSEEALALPLSRLDGGSSGGGVAHYRKPTKPRSYSSGYGPGHVGKSLNVDTNIMKSLPNYFKDPAIKDSVDLTLFKETKRAPAIQWKGI